MNGESFGYGHSCDSPSNSNGIRPAHDGRACGHDDVNALEAYAAADAARENTVADLSRAILEALPLTPPRDGMAPGGYNQDGQRDAKPLVLGWDSHLGGRARWESQRHGLEPPSVRRPAEGPPDSHLGALCRRLQTGERPDGRMMSAHY